MRAVFDANVLVSALLSRSGAPAVLVERWLLGDFELIVSKRLVAEASRALSYPKIRARVRAETASAFVAMLRELADQAPDPTTSPSVQSRDPADDYLIALAQAEKASLVSGDRHLLDLRRAIPVLSPRGFLESL